MKKGLFILLFIFVLVLASCNHQGDKTDDIKTPTPTVPPLQLILQMMKPLQLRLQT